MTSVPDIRPKLIVLHIPPDTTFVARFGKRVKAVGGKYTDVKGRSRTRYVHLPDGHPDLVDEIATAFPRPEIAISFDAWGAEGFDFGYDRRLQTALSHARNMSLRWTRSMGMTPSQAIDAKAAQVSAAFDWATFLAGWDEGNARDAARLRERDLKSDMAETLREVGAEALRVLDGANDLEPLKAKAARYREILVALGIDPDGVTPGTTTSSG